ncbi:uncharacterized protein [Prorops nasuta]|uniref:uncharacterized protein n=1 Tax=Prorops nasuta TaxID=863751 RepID=UPI0034D01E9F
MKLTTIIIIFSVLVVIATLANADPGKKTKRRHKSDVREGGHKSNAPVGSRDTNTGSKPQTDSGSKSDSKDNDKTTWKDRAKDIVQAGVEGAAEEVGAQLAERALSGGSSNDDNNNNSTEATTE